MRTSMIHFQTGQTCCYFTTKNAIAHTLRGQLRAADIIIRCHSAKADQTIGEKADRRTRVVHPSSKPCTPTGQRGHQIVIQVNIFGTC
ncbi:hypothetical protein ACOMHN_004568 [Nucella lapillus]